MTSQEIEPAMADLMVDLRPVVADWPHPLVFASVSGIHQYGFAPPGTTIEIRGVHVLPMEAVLGLQEGEDKIERTIRRETGDIEVVTYDIHKFVGLMLQPDAAFLEHVMSPYSLVTSKAHSRLKRQVRGCLTRHHVKYYWDLGIRLRQEYQQTDDLLAALHSMRAMATCAHMLRPGRIEARLSRLTSMVPWMPPFTNKLIRMVTEGGLRPVSEVRGVPEPRMVLAGINGLSRVITDRTGPTLGSHRPPLPDSPRAETALGEIETRLRVDGVTPART